MLKIKKNLRTMTPNAQATALSDPALHRSGAVARMLSMPVATLRVWERRYNLTPASLKPSGQRLYCAAEVRRLALIKQLTDLGHAIGSLAPLDMQQLQGVACTHTYTQTLAATSRGLLTGSRHAPPVHAWRLLVIGQAIGHRLQRPTLLRRLSRPMVMLGPFDDLVQAAAALQDSPPPDALLIHEPRLHEDWLSSVETAASVFSGVPKAVLYHFAPDSVCEALANAGTALLREPQPDVVVAQWLHNLSTHATTFAQPAPNTPTPSTELVQPRRWDNAALTHFASQLSLMACECPRHVAELLIQLAHFEAYSAECENHGGASAKLHAYLGQVAAAAQASFEVALEQVALHEGLVLPPSRLHEHCAKPHQAQHAQVTHTPQSTPSVKTKSHTPRK